MQLGSCVKCISRENNGKPSSSGVQDIVGRSRIIYKQEVGAKGV